MGRHKKIPRKNGMSREQKKKKFRPQDPFYRGPRAAVDVRIDRPPGKGEDTLDVPEVTSGANMLGPGLAEEVLFGKLSRAAPKASADDGLSGRARKRQRAKERQRKAAEEGGAAGAKAPRKRRLPDGAKVEDKASRAGPKLPRQQPGESAKSYKRRVDAALEEQNKAARRKLVTENQKEKRKQREENKKKTKQAKEEKKALGPEGAQLGRTERPEFGEIVQRPPLLGLDSTKSMAKAKRPREAAGDLEDYASRVREAYAEMKRRRRGS